MSSPITSDFRARRDGYQGSNPARLRTKQRHNYAAEVIDQYIGELISRQAEEERDYMYVLVEVATGIDISLLKKLIPGSHNGFRCSTLPPS